MTWPGWSDILPTVALLVGLAGSVAGVCWVLLRLFQPFAERAADDLYERLKGNDFKHVDDGLKAVGDRIDRVQKDFGGRLDRMDKRIDGVRKEVGERFDRARQDRQDMEARLMDAIADRPNPPPEGP